MGLTYHDTPLVPVPVVVVSAPIAVSADAPDDIAKAALPEAAAKLITKARFIPKSPLFAKTQHIGFACVAARAETNKLLFSQYTKGV
jgi:hypothetical protein